MSAISRDHVLWAYRLLHEREPESEQVIEYWLKTQSLRDLVASFLSSPEFKIHNQRFAAHLVDRWALIETNHGFRIWVNLADAGTSWPVIDEEFEVSEAHFVKHHLSAGATALDIGTNIGFYSMLMSGIVGPAGKVIGFEPIPSIHAYAVRSAAANGFEHCSIFQVALADTRGRMKLFDNPRSTHKGCAYLDRNGGEVPPFLVGIDSEAAPLTDFVDGHVDFIKIDVEGAEHRVLRPYLDRLAEYRPVIMSEVSSSNLARGSGVSPAEYISMLLGLGYDCVDIPTGRRVITDNVPSLTNVAFLPK